MKTFKDLEFKKHPIGNGLMARMLFDNGYGVSVVRFKMPFGGLRNGYGSYTSNEHEWEVAILACKDEESWVCYDTPITSDVIGHQTAKDITTVMKKVQKLKPRGNHEKENSTATRSSVRK